MNKLFRIKNSIPILIMLISILLVISCNSDDSGDGKSGIEQGRESQIQNLYDNQIAPLQQDHITISVSLFEKSQAFSSTINTSNFSMTIKSIGSRLAYSRGF